MSLCKTNNKCWNINLNKWSNVECDNSKQYKSCCELDFESIPENIIDNCKINLNKNKNVLLQKKND